VFQSAPGCAMSVGTLMPLIDTCRPKLDIPDTIYRFIQPGVGARFEFGDIAVSVSAGYRLILNGAGIHFQQFFPHRSVAGLEADAYVGYRFMGSFEARLSLQVRRYFFAMNSTQADVMQMMADTGSHLPKVAGGAIDQYISGGVGVAWLFGGSERPASAEEEPPAAKKKKNKKSADDESEEPAPEE